MACNILCDLIFEMSNISIASSLGPALRCRPHKDYGCDIVRMIYGLIDEDCSQFSPVHSVTTPIHDDYGSVKLVGPFNLLFQVSSC